jgi:hypothetical protein
MPGAPRRTGVAAAGHPTGAGSAGSSCGVGARAGGSRARPGSAGSPRCGAGGRTGLGPSAGRPVVPRRPGRRLAADPAEDHPPRRGLERAADRQGRLGADRVAPVLGDDHGPVLEVADRLSGLLARLDEADGERLARDERGLERVGELVDVEHRDGAEPRDPREGDIAGHDHALHLHASSASIWSTALPGTGSRRS